ncbi:tyrosine-type recombinase/integrase [Stratiformator vulcanicus]|uniref:Site-specific tyrosine recombinase XerC n=1 Tax=Stratiformator vulcanicus TaxID=2527980 RepID=A0A517QY06_9PLAN|nr:site-specific integrase [Stratiformator vulcanicus]QDT36539.1 site-specific tyrosine recombinase XerC [Stratiformator vulcanicus]
MKVSCFRPKNRKNYVGQWVDPVTGRKKTKSLKTPVRRDAERKAAKLERELEEGTFIGTQLTGWEDFRERYESEFLSGKAESTGQKAACAFAAVERTIDPKNLAALDSGQISRMQGMLRKEQLSEATIASYLAHLKSSLRWAAKVGLIGRAPEIDMPKRVPKMKGRAITAEELDRMIAKVPTVVPADAVGGWEDLIRGLWWSGLRIREAYRLHWTDDRELCVDLSGRRPMFRIRAGADKGFKDRMLPVAPEFADLLSKIPDDQRTGFVFNPWLRSKKCGRVTWGTMSKTLVKIGRKAGVKVAESKSGKVKFASAHDLRRSFGTRWAQRVKPAVLQQLMRHASINTTMSYYVGIEADDAADIVWAARPANTLAITGPETKNGDPDRSPQVAN